jgi:putative membrane protein
MAAISPARTRLTELTMRVTSYLTGAIVLTALTIAPRAASARATSAAAVDDPTICAIFDAANTWDIETSEIAVKKGSTKEVRDLGAMFVRDHQSVRQQGRDLVKKLGVTPTPPKDFALATDHEQAMKTLNSTSGKAFDRAYLEHEVSYHKAVVDAIKGTLLPATQNAELKDLQVKVAPAFEAHMLAAQRLLDGMGH